MWNGFKRIERKRSDDIMPTSVMSLFFSERNERSAHNVYIRLRDLLIDLERCHSHAHVSATSHVAASITCTRMSRNATDFGSMGRRASRGGSLGARMSCCVRFFELENVSFHLMESDFSHDT